MRRFALTEARRLADFEGHWRVARDIVDHRAGSTGRFVGTAEFTPLAAGLGYREIGQLHLPGQPPFHAERRYIWRQDDTGIHITFEDGRAFHSITPDAPNATHWCDPDTYDVTYRFDTWPDWTNTWDVSGPRKAYKMITRYSRPGL